ncbi:hypothetical protein [Streptomyces sp. NPDC001658]
MDGYGKPGYSREEFEREMDAELDAVSSLDREYQPSGIHDTEDPQRAAAAAAVNDGLDRLFRRLGPPPVEN